MKNQTTLINFEINNLVKKECPNWHISTHNIIHGPRITKCPKCGSTEPFYYNGYSHEGEYVKLAYIENIKFKKGQQKCPACGFCAQLENQFLNKLTDIMTQKINNVIYSLTELGNSAPDIVYHIKNTDSIPISKSYVESIQRQFYQEVKSSYPELNEPLDEDLQGFNAYDEQYVTVNGVKMLRVVIQKIDKINGDEILYEGFHKKWNKKKLIKLLKKIFKDNIPEGFVFDLLGWYVPTFREVFGKQIKIQNCLFHLNKLITKEYDDAMKFLNKKLWTLEEYKKLYSILDLFYDRTEELKYLDNLIIKRNICNFFNPELKEQFFIKLFKKYLYKEKKSRRRLKQNLQKRSLESASKNLYSLLENANEQDFFPKKIIKRLKKIKENFTLFLGGWERDILTNNRLEGFFGTTLKKFEKKCFNIVDHLSAFLKLKKLRKKGIRIFEPVPWQDRFLLINTILTYKML